jgi:hypothetical protein
LRKSYIDHVKANPQWIPSIRVEGSDGQSLPLDDQTITNLINSYQEFGISDPCTPLIACELVDKVMLSRVNASYCALSYYAGKPTETAVVLVDGLPFNAFANLEHAIGCALECWTSQNPGKELLLWVDQICINQCDPVERGRQIGMMQDIYRRSNETFVCLSTASVDNCLYWVPRDPRPVSEHQFFTQNALVTQKEPRTVTILKHAFQELLLGRDTALSSALPELALSGRQSVLPPPSASVQPQPQSGNLFLQNRPRPQSRHLLSPPYASTQSSNSESTQCRTGPGPSGPVNLVCGDMEVLLESIRAFMECPWWRRSWVYQECIMSPRLYFLSGFTSVSWMELYPVLEFVCSGLDTFLDSMIASVISKAEQEIERARLEAVRRRELQEAQQKREQAKYDAQMNEHYRMLNEKNKLHQIWQEAETKRQEAETKRQEAETKRQREAEQSKHQAIDEYNAKLMNSVAAIASKKATTNPLNFPLRLILKYEMQRIDDKRRNSNRNISKWIHMARRETREHEGSSRALPQDPLIQDIIKWDKAARPSMSYHNYGIYSSASYGPPPPQRPQLPTYANLEIQNDLVASQNEWKEKEKRITALQIRLRDLDSSAVFSMMKGKTKMQRTSDLKELLQHSKNCEASDPRDRVYAFLGLAHRGYGIEPDYTMQNTIIQVLINTTSRIIEHDMSLKVLEHVYQGRNELGHSLPTWVPDWTSKESDRGFKKYDLVWGPGQEVRPFDASKGLLTNAEFRKDDTNELAVDMKVKGVFVDILNEREKTPESFHDLQSFLMPYSGRTLRVISPNSVAVDDEVWVLHGMSQPVVLEHLFDDTYSFLGQVLVCELDGSLSEIMFGQMIQMTEQGRAESREIWIA